MASPPRGLTWDAKHDWLRLDRSMSFAVPPPPRGYALKPLARNDTLGIKHRPAVNPPPFRVEIHADHDNRLA